MFWINRHWFYFRNVKYLGGLIGLQVILASLWHFETVFFPLLMGCFLLAGMHLPFVGIATTGRWLLLAVAALAGFVLWMRAQKHSYSSFHLIAVFCVIAAMSSAAVSNEPKIALLKAVSLFLLFAYGATGARIAIRGREVQFVKSLLLGCEVLGYATAIAYAMGVQIWGNPNSLGAVIGVAIIPFLLWGMLIAETRIQRNRRAIALILVGFMLYNSLSRAGMLAATVAVLTLLIALRQQRLLVKGAFVVFIFVSFAAVVRPAHFAEFVDTVTSNVVHKGRNEEVFSSRKSPWEQTTSAIKQHPWFGSGFGTSDMEFVEQTTEVRKNASSLRTQAGSNREHGNSYLALAEYMGILGLLPFCILLFLIARLIVQVVLYMWRTGNPYHCAVPLAVVLLAGLVHVFFEDWLLAVGYYLCVFFWLAAFWLVDLRPLPAPALAEKRIGARERPQITPPGQLVPSR
jgi:O-antigen ligase